MTAFAKCPWRDLGESAHVIGIFQSRSSFMSAHFSQPNRATKDLLPQSRIERQVMSLRLSDDSMLRAEIATRLGISPSRVGQIAAKFRRPFGVAAPRIRSSERDGILAAIKLGDISDQKIAQKFKVGRSVVSRLRKSLGMTRRKVDREASQGRRLVAVADCVSGALSFGKSGFKHGFSRCAVAGMVWRHRRRETKKMQRRAS
jgi:predicted XRE-type DNA-binding protein